MTIKEQIMKLQTYKMFEGEDTVYVERDDVLKALEQQPTLDTRQRERQLEMEYQHGYDKGWEEGRKALKQQPTDAVSRTLVHEAITASIAESENPYEMWQRIEALPSVTPSRKNGKWIMFEDEVKPFFKCSECKFAVGLDDDSYYCPNCGAEMEVEDEDSD